MHFDARFWRALQCHECLRSKREHKTEKAPLSLSPEEKAEAAAKEKAQREAEMAAKKRLPRRKQQKKLALPRRKQLKKLALPRRKQLKKLALLRRKQLKKPEPPRIWQWRSYYLGKNKNQ